MIDLYRDDCLEVRHNGSTAGIAFAIEMEKQKQTYNKAVKKLIFRCRELGFKAAMPNDGWVNRDDLSITMAYPFFDDNCVVGDKILLAFPDDVNSFRPIVLTKIKNNIFDVNSITKRFYFEDISIQKELLN